MKTVRDRRNQEWKDRMDSTSSLRVAWIVPGFPVDASDPFYPFLAREAQQLASRPDVELMVLTETAAHPDSWPFAVATLERPTRSGAKGLTLARVAQVDPGLAVRAALSRGLWYPPAWRIGAAIAALRKLQPDVIHSHFAVPAGTCGVPVAKALGSASVVSLRGVDVIAEPELRYGYRLDRRYEAALRSSLARVDQCITATSQMREAAIAAGAPPTRSRVIHNSVALPDPSELPPIDRPGSAEIVVLSVGNLTNRKGFDRGIRAMTQLPASTHYDIVGEGPERAHLERLAEDLGVQSRVRFLGARSPLEARARMASCDVYWFLSRHEAFGNVVAEAFTAGCRMVAVREGIAPELLLRDPLCEVLTDADTPAELASATLRVLERSDTPDRTEKLSALRPEIWASAVVDTYRQAIRVRSGRAEDAR